MLKKRGIRYLLSGLVILLLSTVFLGCGGTSDSSGNAGKSSGGGSGDTGSGGGEGADNDLCTITFTSPVNGTVLRPGTTTVTIKGYITAGKSAAKSLTADGVAIPFDASTGAFSYTYAIPSGAIYATSTLTVTDKNNVASKRRVSFAVGQSLQAGAPDVVANAARLVLTEAYMDELEKIIPAYVNIWKNDMIYGSAHAVYGSHDVNSPFAGEAALLPMTIPIGLGSLVIDNARSNNTQGFLNIGPIAMVLDIQPDNTILTDITVSSAPGINPRGGSADAAIFIQGYHNLSYSFAFYASGIDITGAKLALSMDAATNQIVATLDTTDATIAFSGENYEYGGLEAPVWLKNIITDLVASTLKAAIDVPIMKASSLSITADGISAGAWPMNAGSLFVSTDSSLTMDLGLYAVLENPAAALISGLASFYATPDDALPTMTMMDSENVNLAVTDDIMNNLAFVTVQSGFIKDVNVTAEVKEELIEDLGKDLAYILTPSKLVVFTSLETPPIFDFSSSAAGAGPVYPAGWIIMRNLLIDISFNTIDGSPHFMKLSADVDGPLMIALDGNGYLTGRVNATGSTCSIMTLYSSDVSAVLVPDVTGPLANAAINRILQRMIKIEPPRVVDLYGVAIGYSLVGTEVSDNCLIIKGLVNY